MRNIITLLVLTLWQIGTNSQLVCNVAKYDENTGMAQWRVNVTLHPV